MPYLEVFDYAADPAQRQAATRGITRALCQAYEIPSEIVTLYFHNIDASNYGHDSAFGVEAQAKRFFIKLHAYPRSDQFKREAAAAVTRAAAEAYAVSEQRIAIYFFERPQSEVAHAGRLACD